MTTLDSLDPDALYVPGLRFWSRTYSGRFAIVAQNVNGAIELWHAMRDPDVGQLLAHSPTPRDGYDAAAGCVVLGGPCHARESFPAYTHDFRPLLAAGEDKAVLRLLADWHDQTLGTRVTTS